MSRDQAAVRRVRPLSVVERWLVVYLTATVMATAAHFFDGGVALLFSSMGVR